MLVAAVSSCARTPAQQPVAAGDVRTMVDDRTTGDELGRFHYAGRWEDVSGRSDGRSLGTSTRSFHPADVASLSFVGTQVRLYGVVGPKGGDALVAVDGSRGVRRISFRAPAFAVNSLVYTSPPLASGEHTLTIFVTGRDAPRGRRGYVNVDSAVISNAPLRDE